MSDKRGERLEQRFESSLARRVADRGTGKPWKKRGILFGAVAVCAILSVSALYSVAMTRESGAPVLEDIIFHAEKAYLTEEVSDGDTVVYNTLAIRTMNLKVKGDHLYAEEYSPLHYAKFVYSLSVVIVDSAEEAWEGMTLGNLTLPDVGGISGSMVLTVAASVTRIVDEVPTTIDVDENTVAETDGCDVIVKIPELTNDGDVYASGDSISISVAIETDADLQDELNPDSSEADLDGGLVTETAWDDPLTEISTEIDVGGY
ncbi:MAG: hypothetical protein JSV94_01200 [Methanobacteriota archaeon]|nr:MAG: hypothetical protein JSV94_01200 [Euryarchaeota archaeon]